MFSTTPSRVLTGVFAAAVGVAGCGADVTLSPDGGGGGDPAGVGGAAGSGGDASGGAGGMGGAAGAGGTCLASLGGDFAATGPTVTSPSDHLLVARPVAAMADDGRYAIAWNTLGQRPFNLVLQRYSAAGVAEGTALQVAPYPEHYVHYAPAVAIGAAGETLVAWTNSNDPFAVYARRIDSAGVLQEPIIQVSDEPGTYVNRSPALAIASSGSFVVAWSATEDSSADVRFRRYGGDGAALSDVTPIAAAAGHYAPYQPAVAVDGSGHFVVAWTAGDDIYQAFAQVFDADGTPLGDVAQVSRSGQIVLAPPAVATTLDGRFVVAYHDAQQEGAIFARRYDAAGAPLASELEVNESPPHVDVNPPGAPPADPDAPPQGVGVAANGDFVVSWTNQANFAPYFRRFDAAGVALTSEQSAATATDFSSLPAAIAVARCTGSHVVAWTDQGDFMARHTLYLAE